MKKEVVIAIFVGLSLGLIVAFGVRTAQRSLKNRARINPTPETNSMSTAASESHTLLITAPNPDEVVADSELNIVGSTTANAMVSIIGTNAIETTTIADDTGAFNAPVELSPGVNVINISSYDPSGNEGTTTLSVVLSTADLSATASGKTKK